MPRSTEIRRARVAKIGGSLFDLPDLRARLTSWLINQPPLPTLWMCGGGRFVEALRDWQSHHRLSDYDAHLGAIHLMCFALNHMRPWFSDWPWFSRSPATVCWPEDDAREVQSAGGDESASNRLWTNAFFDCEEWLAGAEEFPHDWSFTSDSIAAALATEVRAAELVLFKSRLPSPSRDRTQLQADGLVDGLFAHYSASVPLVRLVDLRSTDFSEWRDACVTPQPAP